jgi:hypothetical protein
MKCRQSEELWSDYVEGILPSPLRRDLEEHLEACNDCARLMASFRNVVDTLTALPRPQPAPDLLENILRATRPRLHRQRSRSVSIFPGLPLPKWSNWAFGAAAAAVLVVLFLQPPAALSSFAGQINQWGHRTYSFGLRAYRGSERLIDELNVLRVAVGVVFEDRLDRINERLKDLEEARRKSEDPPETSSDLVSPQRLTRLDSIMKQPIARSLL